MSFHELITHISHYPTIFGAIPAAVLCYIPMKNQRRMSLRRIALHGFLLMLFAVAGIIAINMVLPGINGTVLLLPFLGIFFLYYTLSVRASLSQCLAVFTAVLTLYAIPSFVAYIADAVYNPEGGAGNTSIVFAVIQLGSIVLLTVIYAYFFYRWGQPLVDSLRKKEVWISISIMSLIVFALLCIMVPNEYGVFFFEKIRSVYLLVFTLISILYVLIIFFFAQVSISLVREEELQEQELMYRMQRKQYKDLQMQNDKVRIMRHDMKHTINMLHRLAAEGDLEQIRNFLNEYTGTIPSQTVIQYCDNDIINTILNFYVEKAEAEEVQARFFVDLPEISDVQTNDLVSVLGNLLENAMQGCETVTEGERWINLRLAVINNENLYIVTSNTFDGKVRKNGRTYLTTRRKRGGKGIGLRSIRAIVEKYDGQMDVYHKDKVFYVDLSMKKVGPNENS